MSSLTRGGCARRSSTMLVHLRQRSCGHWSTQPRAVGWWAIAWAGPPERSRSWTRQGRSSRGAGSEVVPGSKVSVFLGGSKKTVTTKAPFSRCSPGCGTRQCSRRAPTRNKGMPVTLKETRACRRGPDRPVGRSPQHQRERERSLPGLLTAVSVYCTTFAKVVH